MGPPGDSPKARPFRFACRVSGGRSRTPTEWAALAKRAEALGYATFAVADHFATQYAPMQLLQYAADQTSRIRLATLVLDNDFRHPTVLAKEAATLDVLSGGRLELGLGAGWLLQEYRQAGIAFQDGPTRAARLEEGVHLLKALFSDAPASFSGRFYTVHELDGRPKPHQRPHPTLMIGGTRPRLLRFAAREADIVGFDSGPPIRACGALMRCVARPTWCMRRWARAPPSCTSTQTSGAWVGRATLSWIRSPGNWASALRTWIARLTCLPAACNRSLTTLGGCARRSGSRTSPFHPTRWTNSLKSSTAWVADDRLPSARALARVVLGGCRARRACRR